MSADVTPARTASGMIRAGLLILGVWVAFFLLQAAVSTAIAGRGLSGSGPLIEIEVAIAVVWAMFSIGIAAWHRFARSITSNLFALVALHIPTLVAAALLDTLFGRIAITVFSGPPATSFSAMLLFYADLDVVSYVAVVAVAEALLVRRALLERQRLAERLEGSLNRARLDYLEAQLQPHFLFNSLGAVSELAYDAPATAARVLRQLIAIFRTALARRTDEVTLGEEIVGIEPYLDIQRIRFADWLTIDYQIDEATVDCLLPRFILQPLVENAIRHGLSRRSTAGTIDISAALRGDSLVVRVADNGVGLDASASSTGRGIGLANVRDRLAILYGDDDRLRLTSNASAGAVAELTIPARRKSEATPPAVGDAAQTPSLGETDLRTVRIPAFLRLPAVAILVTWFAWGLLWTQQSFMYLVVRNRLGNASWFSIARNDMVSALIWAALTPVVLAAAKRFPVTRAHVVLRSSVYVVAGALTTIVHAGLLQRFTMPGTALWSATWQATFATDFVIFCILTAVGHRGVLAEWLRAREADAAALTAQLEAAQTRAVKLQAIPPVLLRSLSGIADTARSDPALTERQLTRLADYLRLALECTDERGITPDRERALDVAVGALRDSGAYSIDLSLSP